jgi:hypothetical protein
MGLSKSAWKNISTSFIAGTCFSFPVAWAVCSFALGWLAEPIPNALLGICISFLIYTVAFAVLSKRSINSVVKGLATKTFLEMTLRGLIHGGMMFAAFPASWASFVAQLFAGFIGHFSVTAFVENEENSPEPNMK